MFLVSHFRGHKVQKTSKIDTCVPVFGTQGAPSTRPMPTSAVLWLFATRATGGAERALRSSSATRHPVAADHRNREARIFFIYDSDTMVVLFNCFIKKTQKTPRKEMEKAKRLKNEYNEDE